VRLPTARIKADQALALGRSQAASRIGAERARSPAPREHRRVVQAPRMRPPLQGNRSRAGVPTAQKSPATSQTTSPDLHRQLWRLPGSLGGCRMTRRPAMGSSIHLSPRRIREATNRPESLPRHQHHPQGLVPGDGASPPWLRETKRRATTPRCRQAAFVVSSQHPGFAQAANADSSYTSASRPRMPRTIRCRTHFKHRQGPTFADRCRCARSRATALTVATPRISIAKSSRRNRDTV
jgi:hypothetical protein